MRSTKGPRRGTITITPDGKETDTPAAPRPGLLERAKAWMGRGKTKSVEATTPIGRVAVTVPDDVDRSWHNYTKPRARTRVVKHHPGIRAWARKQARADAMGLDVRVAAPPLNRRERRARDAAAARKAGRDRRGLDTGAAPVTATRFRARLPL